MKVFICLSVSNKIDQKYFALAKEVSSYLASNNFHLVIGASGGGMVDELIDIFNKKTSTYAIVHNKYKDETIGLSHNFELVDNTFKRLEKIFDVSDIFIVLPGGVGTLSELFCLLEELRTNDDKKLILFNYESYYDKLILFIKESIKTGFIKETDFKKITIVNTFDEFKKEVI